MKIIKFKRVKNCLQSNNMVNIYFDSALSRDFINYLSSNAKLNLYENLPKPFFVIEAKKKYLFKGALGNNNARIYLPEENCEETLEEFRQKVELF